MKKGIFKALFILFWAVLLGSCSEAQAVPPQGFSGAAIQAAIDATPAGGTVDLPAGTYTITSTIRLKSNITIQGTRSSILRLANQARWSSNGSHFSCGGEKQWCTPPLIEGNSVRNVRFEGFTMDGNWANQYYACSPTSKCDHGKGYYKLFSFIRSHDITFNNMQMGNNSADAIQFRNGSNLIFTNNVVNCTGHEAVYFMYSTGLTASNNNVLTCTNSSFRMSDSSYGRIFQNHIYSASTGRPGSPSTGPGIEIDGSSHVQIYENNIHDVRGSGILVFSRRNTPATDVTITNNRISNTGTYHNDNGKSNGGITFGHVSNLRIENNVIERSGTLGAAIIADVPFGADGGNSNVIARGNTLIGNAINFIGSVIQQLNNCIGSSCPVNLPNVPVPPMDPMPSGGAGGSAGGSGVSLSNDEICATYNRETKRWDHVGDENHNGYADCADPACKCIVPPPIVAPWLGSPIAVIDEGAQRITGSGKTITLHGGNSRDTDGGNITSYLWSAEGGTPTSGNAANFEVSFSTAGTHKVVLQVTDNDGMVSKAEISVVVKDCQGNICDKDNDTYLSPAYGGNDCDDEHSTVHPGTKCLSQCAGDNIIQGDCSDEGKCINEVQIASCIGMGDPCKMDVCQPQPDGNVHCAADVTRDLCHGGILPCGKLLNNPDTPFDETLPCNFCAMLLLAQLIIEWMVRMSAFFAVFMITVAGIMYIFGLGSPDQINQARATIKYALIGFAVVLIAWSIINSLLLTAGYINPLGGDWYTACN